MSFLGKDRRANAETATGRKLDDAAENATHAVVARALQDVLEQAGRFHALYRGIDVTPDVSVNTTYADPTIDPQIAAILWQAVVADRMPMETFIAFVRTGQLPDDFDAAEYALLAAANADVSGIVADETATERATGATPSAKPAKTPVPFTEQAA